MQKFNFLTFDEFYNFLFFLFSIDSSDTLHCQIEIQDTPNNIHESFLQLNPDSKAVNFSQCVYDQDEIESLIIVTNTEELKRYFSKGFTILSYKYSSLSPNCQAIAHITFN